MSCLTAPNLTVWEITTSAGPIILRGDSLVSSEFLTRCGAVEGGLAAGYAPAAGVAAHYGDPLSEQRALAAGSAIVDLSHRSVLTISGPDRLSWIDSLTSQSVARLAPGESGETLLLDVTGRLKYAVV